VWFRHTPIRSIGFSDQADAGRPKMPYRTMGWIHARAARLLRGEAGQGTVEYVGLMLMLAALLAGVILAANKLDGKALADSVAKKLKDTIEGVGPRK
jgi:hypothetical protein